MKKKILIVDDELDILQFLKRRLERNNYEVTTTDNGEKCLAIALEEQPDLVILDIVMPSMDGYEIIKKLRGSPRTKRIPIIMHSVKKETKSIFKSMDLGSIDYVIKPVSFEVLLKVIRRYV